MDALISVIIPIYNVCQYVKRCIDSVIEQTYKNLEIILVDDGSTDSSGKICDEYALKDSRVIVIHKKNGGLSDARNAALKICKGELLTFIDGDDFVSRYYIENLYEALSSASAQMSACQAYDFFDGDDLPEDRKADSSKAETYSAHDYLKKMLYQDNAETTAWGKLFYRNMFSDVFFPKGAIYEDIPTIYKIVLRCEKTVIIHSKDYYYLQRSDSIQYRSFTLRKMDAVKHMRQLCGDVLEIYPDLKKAAACRWVSLACNICFQIRKGEYPEETKELWDIVRANRFTVLTDNSARKKARAASLLSYLGMSVLRSVYIKTQPRGQRNDSLKKDK